MSDDLVGDEFTNRPDDDELAFLHYEKMFRAPLDEAIAQLRENEKDVYWDSYNHFMQTYINSVLSTVKALDLGILQYWMSNPQISTNPEHFLQIRYDIDGVITEIKVRHAQRVRKSSVRLQPETRKKIRDLINKIKLTIDGIDRHSRGVRLARPSFHSIARPQHPLEERERYSL